MRIAREAWPFVGGALAVFALCAALAQLAHLSSLALGLAFAGVLLAAGMLFFFRDPEREVTADAGAVLSGADGLVRSVEEMEEPAYLEGKATRISVFLSIFDVHVNRTPLSGRVRKVEYTPGKHLFAYLDAASEYNEHTTILIEGAGVSCLVRQIVGPVARRVVCWLKQGHSIAAGQRLGIMKFGSRLDVYVPSSRVKVEVRKGDRVVAGRTVIATLKREQDP